LLQSGTRTLGDSCERLASVQSQAVSHETARADYEAARRRHPSELTSKLTAFVGNEPRIESSFGCGTVCPRRARQVTGTSFASSHPGHRGTAWRPNPLWRTPWKREIRRFSSRF
jgi:hypothetical protein